MTRENDLDPILDSWFHGQATTVPPSWPLARVIEATRTVQPRSALVARVGSSWTDTDRIGGVVAGLRPALVLTLVALLALVLTGGALLVGGQLLSEPFRPSPFLTVNGVIAVATDGDILVADRPGGELRPLVAGPEDDGSPSFSPDGTKLAFLRQNGAGDPSLMLADADGSNVVEIHRDPMGYGFTPDWRSLIAVARVDATWRVVLRSFDQGVGPTVLDVELDGTAMVRSEAGGPSFNPADPSELLVVGRRAPDGPRAIHVVDLATGEVRTIREEVTGEYLYGAAWLPDGEHITYHGAAGDRVVGADGAGDEAFDGLRGKISPFSNDGTRFVAERGGQALEPGRPQIVRIDGAEDPVMLQCGDGTDTACPDPSAVLVWSPDDSMLIGTILAEASDPDEDPFVESYVLIDSATGQVTELDWPDVGTPVWQRVVP